jgi:hypothetical protein
VIAYPTSFGSKNPVTRVNGVIELPEGIERVRVDLEQRAVVPATRGA